MSNLTLRRFSAALATSALLSAALVLGAGSAYAKSHTADKGKGGGQEESTETSTTEESAGPGNSQASQSQGGGNQNESKEEKAAAKEEDKAAKEEEKIAKEEEKASVAEETVVQEETPQPTILQQQNVSVLSLSVPSTTGKGPKAKLTKDEKAIAKALKKAAKVAPPQAPAPVTSVARARADIDKPVCGYYEVNGVQLYSTWKSAGDTPASFKPTRCRA